MILIIQTEEDIFSFPNYAEVPRRDEYVKINSKKYKIVNVCHHLDTDELVCKAFKTSSL